MSLRPEDTRRIGGSDIAALMGMDPYRTSLSVWTRIVHGVETPDNPAMARGRRLEPVVIDWYRETSTRLVTEALETYPRDRRFRVTLDAVSGVARNWRVVEAKTVGRQGAGSWGEPGTDEIPDGYALQCQWYLGHALREGWVQEDVADVPVLLAGDFALYQVRFDPEVFGMAEEAAARFWRNHVETGRPPTVTPTAQDAALVSRIRRRPELPMLDFESLTGAQRESVRHYVRHLEVRNDAQAILDESEPELKLLVAGHGGLELPQGWWLKSITWQERKGRTTVDWEAVARGMISGDLSFDTLVRQYTKQSAPTRAWCPQKAEGT